MNERLLVVDDDRVTRHLICSILEAEGFTVTSASDGAEALERIRNDHPRHDLMLLDVWMPRMSGLELLNRLRAVGRRPKTIVMTGDDTPGTMLEALRGQALHFLAKPVEPERLLEVVRAALDTAFTPGIEIVSARPDWVELVVPCDRESATFIEGFLAHLDADLTPDVRESIGYAFRELLLNAIEWGGKLDPTRTVRIAYLRAKRMLLYRIADPGPGFRMEDLGHAAIAHPEDPIEHMRVREEQGLRPGGFGLMLVKAKVDELIYNEARNEVVFIKYLEG